MEKAEWFFDVVSPYCYLHYHALNALRDRLEIVPVPILFAGLLKRWETKGPAEIPSKRLHTYQFCVWLAQRQGVPFAMPPRHPFNPLGAQRLLVSLGADDENVRRALDFVFGEGRDPERELHALGERLNVSDVDERIARADVKRQLMDNTERALSLGVFGVPTLRLRERLFWGSDTVEWARDFCDDPDLFKQAGYEAAAQCEFGIARR